MQKAKEIILEAKKDVFGGNIGENISVFKGEGLDFYEIREYRYGDDVKKLNHKATAKLNELKVNVFNEEKELNIVIAIMINGSLYFGSKKSKQEIIAKIIALIGFSSIKHHNHLKIVFFEDTQQKLYQINSAKDSLEEVVEDFLSLELIKKDSTYLHFSDYFNQAIRKKSIIFIISDFFKEIDFSQISAKNQLYSLMIRDRFEEFPYLDEEISLIDTNSLNQDEFILTKDVANNYKKLLEELDEKMYEHFSTYQISFGKIYTDDDVFKRLSQIIKG